MVRFALLLSVTLAIFASFVPFDSASADPHKDKFRRDCATTRKCY
jgi:hypothetical protein